MVRQSDTLARRTIPRPVYIITAVAVIGGLYFIRDYFGIILFSALIALIFNPVYLWLKRKLKYEPLAIAGTLLAIALSVIIPLVVIVTLSVTQIAAMVNDVKASGIDLGPAHVQEVVERGAERVNDLTAALPGGDKIQIDRDKIVSTLQSIGSDVLQAVANGLKNVGSATFEMITLGILSVFLIIGMFVNQRHIIRMLKRISPYDEAVMDLYFGRTAMMTKAMVKGQFLIAAAQGLASAFSLWIVGIDYFWFFLMILTFLSFIPLGAGVVTIPIGIVLILTGHVAQGLFLIVYHVTVVSFIDNIMRPRLVPKEAKLNTAVMLLAVFAGIAAFGAPGVVYGPVVMILIITTLHLYADFNDQTGRVHLPRSQQPVDSKAKA